MCFFFTTSDTVSYDTFWKVIRAYRVRDSHPGNGLIFPSIASPSHQDPRTASMAMACPPYVFRAYL